MLKYLDCCSIDTHFCTIPGSDHYKLLFLYGFHEQANIKQAAPLRPPDPPSPIKFFVPLPVHLEEIIESMPFLCLLLMILFVESKCLGVFLYQPIKRIHIKCCCILLINLSV